MTMDSFVLYFTGGIFKYFFKSISNKVRVYVKHQALLLRFNAAQSVLNSSELENFVDL